MHTMERTGAGGAGGVDRDAAGSDGVTRATGRSRSDWFSLLDAAQAAGWQYRERFDWLVGEHGLSRWWAQKLVIEYEESRGLRPPGIRRDGSFEIGASKVIGADPADVREAFVRDETRDRWLEGVGLRTIDASSLRFEMGDGSGRVTIMLERLGPNRTQVAVRQDRIPDAETAARSKARWRAGLEALKRLLEADDA